MRTTLRFLLASALLSYSLFAQAPIQRNPWSTNVTGNAVLGLNNLSVTNQASGTNWTFYGVNSNTVARLYDVTNSVGALNASTNLWVLRAGDTMTGPLATVGLTNTGGFTNLGTAYISGTTSIGTNAGPARLNIDGGGASPMNAPLFIGTNGTALVVVTNARVGINTAAPTTALDVIGSIYASLNIRAGSIRTIGWSSRSLLGSGTDGYIDATDSGAVDFYGLRAIGSAPTNSMLYFQTAGRASDGVPKLDAKLADNSDWTDFKARRIILDDATSTPGNARGVNAVDLQAGRSSATNVASGASSLVAGTNSSATTLGSVALGISCFASGASASFAAGYGARATASYSVALGNSTASGVGSYGFGQGSTAAGHQSTALGFNSATALAGEMCLGSGKFAANGDAQASKVVAKGIMTIATSTVTNLTLTSYASSALPITIPANTSWGFTIQVVGRTTDAGTGDEESGYYKIEGLIERDNTAANTRIVGSPVYVAVAEDDAAWDAAVSADTTNGALTITVTGNNETTIRWVATVTLTQVGG